MLQDVLRERREEIKRGETISLEEMFGQAFELLSSD